MDVLQGEKKYIRQVLGILDVSEGMLHVPLSFTAVQFNSQLK